MLMHALCIYILPYEVSCAWRSISSSHQWSRWTKVELWDWPLTVSKDAEMKAWIRGVKSMMTTFDFWFGCTLGEQLLRQTDNLCRAWQDFSTSAAHGNRLTQDVVKTLLKDRTDSSCSLFGFGSYMAKLQRFRLLRILIYPGREKHESGTNLENRTPTTFLKLPKTITNESILMR